MEKTAGYSTTSSHLSKEASLSSCSSMQHSVPTTPILDYEHGSLTCSETMQEITIIPPAHRAVRACPVRRNLLLPTNTSTIDPEPDLVHVPGVPLDAYISREILLREIASSLGLTIHSRGIFTESASSVRAWIEMDIPPGINEIAVQKKTFYSDVTENRYNACEGAAQAVIMYLIKEKGANIKDANYDELISLKKALHAAQSFQDIYKENEQIKLGYIASLKDSTNAILSRLQRICIDHAGFLPLEISALPGSSLTEQKCSVRYIGHVPPTTLCETLAMQLNNLASVRTVAGLIVEE